VYGIEDLSYLLDNYDMVDFNPIYIQKSEKDTRAISQPSLQDVRIST